MQTPGLWAIVPVKPFAEGKSRLAPLLNGEQRSALSRSLLGRTLEIATGASCFAGVVVVSRDPQVLALAAEAGALALREDDHDLNAALEQARIVALAQAAAAILVLPADLPALEAEELRSIAGMATGDGVVIAPSSTGGTNVLLLRPPGLFPFAYGPGSFERHLRLAVEAGQNVQVVRSPTLAFDVDLPGDLAHPLLEPYAPATGPGISAYESAAQRFDLHD